MKTGAEKVLKWFRNYSEQNGTPTPFEIRCQLELAIDEEKLELKNLRLDAVVRQSEQLVCDYKYHNRDVTTNGECTKCESHKWR